MPIPARFCPSCEAYCVPEQHAEDMQQFLTNALTGEFNVRPDYLSWVIGNNYGPTCICPVCGENSLSPEQKEERDQARWEQQQEDLASAPPPTQAELHHAAWLEHQEAHRR